MPALNGPRSPDLLNLIRWIAMPLSYMRDCNDRYGDCFALNLGYKMPRTIVFSHPRALEMILTTPHSEEFDAPGDLNAILEPLLGVESVIGLSGDRHRRMRNLMMPPFHGERMRAYGDLINQITDEVTRTWAVGKPFFLRKVMQTISMRVILRAVFGLEQSRSHEMEALLGKLLDLLGNPFGVSFLYFPFLRKDFGSLSPWGSFIRKRERIDRLIYDEIADRRAHPDDARTDILSLLMSARTQEGEPLTDNELRDELMTLLAAGHETTATALTWAFYWIHKFPGVRERLLAEFRHSDSADHGAIARLPYLNAVCSETLRIYPVGMLTFPRRTTSKVDVMGYVLEPGTVVIGAIYLTHRRKEIYPDPEKFRPERFLERRFSAFEYLPFGAGARRCIGMAFAQFEMKLVIKRILSAFELGLVGDRWVRPVRRGLTSGPSPFRMVVRKKVESPAVAGAPVATELPD
jgi:cytochrome P450 family 110